MAVTTSKPLQCTFGPSRATSRPRPVNAQPNRGLTGILKMLQELLSALERHIQDDKNKAALTAICKKSPWDDVGARASPSSPHQH